MLLMLFFKVRIIFVVDLDVFVFLFWVSGCLILVGIVGFFGVGLFFGIFFYLF